ncbi:MAG: D-glycero-alpha-D-manno-heptose-1,7-bisphosphate 7-phosphatase [Planctomycetota bacterium]|jgi:D-glycero-D-manno-heptose 1,7-bisphosphate phosphatase
MSNKAIFLDRDDTLIEDPGYISHPDQVKLLDGVAQALAELKNLGYKLIIVSNQAAVARGIVTEKVLGEIHDRLKQLLAEKGAYLDQIYYCPYHPDGTVAKYRKNSHWRKPNPGMLLAAAEKIDIDLSRSWLIGNNRHDVEAGLQAGCKTILVSNSLRTNQMELGGPTPDYRAVNMKEAVNIIKKHLRSAPPAHEQPQLAPVPQGPPEAETDQLPQQQSDELEKTAAEHDSASQSSEQILSDILNQLKAMHRTNMFSEFSIMRLLAGVVQIAVLFCL